MRINLKHPVVSDQQFVTGIKQMNLRVNLISMKIKKKNSPAKDSKTHMRYYIHDLGRLKQKSIRYSAVECTLAYYFIIIITLCVLKGTTGPSAGTTRSPSSELTSTEGELRLLPGESEAV